MNKLISQIYTQISKSTEKQTKLSTKKPLIDDLPKRLLELEFRSNHSMKSRCLKWIAKNILQTSKKSKTHNQK